MRVSVQDGKSFHELYRLEAVPTNRAGIFVKKLYITRKSVFTAEITTPIKVLPASSCVASFGLPCVSAYSGGSHLLSQVVTVTPYRR